MPAIADVSEEESDEDFQSEESEEEEEWKETKPTKKTKVIPKSRKSVASVSTPVTISKRKSMATPGIVQDIMTRHCACIDLHGKDIKPYAAWHPYQTF